MAKKCKQYAINIRINIKNTLVEVYHSIDMVEHYYRPLWQVYSIITIKIPDIESEFALQMSFKTINNLLSLNRLVSNLLIFSAYPRMTELNTLFLSITQHIIDMKKAIDEV